MRGLLLLLMLLVINSGMLRGRWGERERVWGGREILLVREGRHRLDMILLVMRVGGKGLSLRRCGEVALLSSWHGECLRVVTLWGRHDNLIYFGLGRDK